MNYTSIAFYLFVLTTLVFYYILPLCIRWMVLLFSSGAFYFMAYKTGWWIVAATTLLAYGAGLLIELLKKRNPDSGRILLRLAFAAAVSAAAFPWLAVKNGNFILGSILRRPAVYWIVPLGISFYTLQIISYLADVYTGKIRAQKNPAKYALFVLYFPQFVQGPIPRYDKLAGQLYQGRPFREDLFVRGLQYIIWGFFLKLMIADKAAVIVDEVFAFPDKYTGCYCLTAGVLYSIELYADFLSCVKISQGVSYLFGIELSDNFKRPYFAGSIHLPMPNTCGS